MPAIAFCAAMAYAQTASGDAAALLQKGEFKKAAALLEKAHAENPSDPEITMLYATTLPDAARALEMLKKIALDKSLPDSLRSEAHFRLGCANYLWSRFHKASGYFVNAAGISGKNRDVEACYLNAIHDTIDSSFVATMRKVAEDTALAAGKTANFYLGVYYYSKRDYRRALSHFGACVDSSESASRACAAHAGAYLCAAGLSRYEKADSVLAFIKQEYPAYLEKTMVEKAAAKPLPALKKDSAIKKDAAALLPPDSTASKKSSVKKAEPNVRKALFSLQAGAFSTMENAEALKTELSKQFSQVSITAGSSGDKTVYRVRVGAFDTKESAQAFGDSSLVKKGMKFQIVEEMK
jgi:cell division septation protein DedD